MKNPTLTISLDFELFWGLCGSGPLSKYSKNVIGEWVAIPKLLKVFKRYDISATWATVGMAMCKDFKQWSDIRPAILPKYLKKRLSSYEYADLVNKNQSAFFGRPLIEQILSTPGQELGGHTYSHFYTAEPGATEEQFTADLECAEFIAKEIGVNLRSFVFPKNQFSHNFIKILNRFNYTTYRGNPFHWIYESGHEASWSITGRGVRFLDQYISVTGKSIQKIDSEFKLLNNRASFFLRPYNKYFSMFDEIRINRLKKSMLEAALTKGNFHLWWHPHNFGTNLDENLKILEILLDYYLILKEEYDMKSIAMQESYSVI